jgi:hypothetical protein
MVALVAVRLVKKAVTEFNRLAKKLVEVALVVVEFEALKFVVKMFAALVVPVRVRLFRDEIVVVAITPFTFRVRRLVAVAYVRFVVVVELIRSESEVVATTPLTVVVMIPVLVAYETEFPVMIDEVAVDPPRLEVRIFPAAPRVLEVTRFVMVALVAVRLVKKAVTEFNRLAKKLVVVALVIVALVPNKEVAVRAVAEALVREVCPVAVNCVAVVVASVLVPVTVTNLAVRVLVALMFPITEFVPVELVNTSLVIVAFVLTKLVKNPVVALISVEKKLVVVALVTVALVANREFAVNAEAVAFPNVV